LFQGGFPEPVLHSHEQPQFHNLWMENYLADYVNRDIRALFPRLNIHSFRRFLSLLAQFSGHPLNMSSMARALEVTVPTIRDYLDIIHQTFLWRNLPPYTKNPMKKVQKSNKGWFRDTGVLHYYLRINDIDNLMLHPVAGFSFESFATEEIIRGLQATLATQLEYSYYRTVDRSEVDLVIEGPFGIISWIGELYQGDEDPLWHTGQPRQQNRRPDQQHRTDSGELSVRRAPLDSTAFHPATDYNHQYPPIEASPVSTLIKDTKVTPEEYLEGEELSEYKHEYEDGRIIAMVGASRNHNIIQINLTLAIGNHLLGKTCRVFSSDMKVRHENTFYYPDLSVGCEQENHDQYLEHPLLVVEVFSTSSEKRDRSIKRLTYQAIPSLQEILLFSQDKMQAECYRRLGNDWILERYQGNEILRLDSVDLEVPLEQIYDGVELKYTPGSPDAA
jgi:Uma2 family endonuclease